MTSTRPSRSDRRPHGVVSIAAALALLAAPALAQAPGGMIPGGIPGVVAPGLAPVLVQEGFTFLEGPVGLPDGGLYFTDIPANRIHHLDRAGQITVLYEQSGGANGLAFSANGTLFAAEGKRISRRGLDSVATTATVGPAGAPLLLPNDLILDAKGGVYFTDPGPRPVVPGRPTYVYYLPAGAAAPHLIDGTVARPNGLTLSPSGKTLIVDDTIGTTVFAYDVQPDGKVRNKRRFTELRDIPAGKESGADGLALDREGRLYITTLVGIQVFDAGGGYLGTIAVPRQPSNLAFAGPAKRTLFITAREGLYRLEMLSTGPDRPGK